MREIKFRVWDEHYRYMNYKVIVGMWGKESLNDENYTTCSMYIMPDKVDYKCKPHWANFEPYMEDIHLMQYTGLKDSEGTEIYEGDILESVAFGSEEIGKIIYSEDDAMFELDTDGVVLNFSNENSKWWTVIGNIYENPELLGE